jgi:hypothetical protein
MHIGIPPFGLSLWAAAALVHASGCFAQEASCIFRISSFVLSSAHCLLLPLRAYARPRRPRRNPPLTAAMPLLCKWNPCSASAYIRLLLDTSRSISFVLCQSSWAFSGTIASPVVGIQQSPLVCSFSTFLSVLRPTSRRWRDLDPSTPVRALFLVSGQQTCVSKKRSCSPIRVDEFFLLLLFCEGYVHRYHVCKR